MRTLLVLVGLCCADTARAESLCSTIGYSGKLEGVRDCVNGTDQRTITCVDGYVVTNTMKPSITLRGRTPFPGCTLIDPCHAFGYSGKQANVQSCTNGTDGQRTITCVAPFVVSGTTGATIKLLGAAPFPGCVADTTDHCKRYGYSGKPANVKECVNGTAQRTITCLDGFVVTGTDQPSIVLAGGKPFPGCGKAPSPSRDRR